MNRQPHLVVLGLSLSSSWGNGHATTYRSLLRGLHALGWRITFLERDVPWYRGAARDLPAPDFCALEFYESLEDLARLYGGLVAHADHVIVGSYVPDGPAVIDWLCQIAQGTLSFYDIDTPVTLAALDEGNCAYLRREQIPRFDAYFSFSGGDTLRRLHETCGARRPEALYCSVDNAACAPLDDIELRWDLGYLGTYSPDRQPMLERLLLATAQSLPHRRFVVAGPQYPDDIDWPANVDRIEHVPPAEHAAFYGRQRFTLNITRADMARLGWSPSVRLFEAAACAVPVISDFWRGLVDLLPCPDAILIAHHTAGVIDILEATDESQRRAIGRAARDRVLAAHTGRMRAGELAAVLHDLSHARRTPQTSAWRP